jgi:hypothetical protein
MDTKWHNHDDYVTGKDGRKWAMACFRAGIATDFMVSLRKHLARDRSPAVVLYTRVSQYHQKKRGNLVESMKQLRADVSKSGCNILGEYQGVENGSSKEEFRSALDRAVACAKANNAVIVAPSRCRFIRDSSYNGTNASDAPTIAEYRELKRIVGQVPLVTVLHPNKHARFEQVQRGQQQKGRMGGRPRTGTRGAGATKLRREKYLLWVCTRRESGWSLRRIAAELSRRRSGFPAPTAMTISNWLKRYS